MGLQDTINPKRYGYWSDNTIKIEIQDVINNLGYFPTYGNLANLNRYDLSRAISKHGGFPKFELLMGFNIKRKRAYWTDDVIKIEIQKIIDSFGNFPTHDKLASIGRNDLSVAIVRHGGYTKFRKMFLFEPIKMPNYYWTNKKIIKNLKNIINDINHFPSISELIKLNKNDLVSAISRKGGFNNFRTILGCPISLQEKYGKNKYNVIRGKNTEKIIINILKDWCKIHNYPEPNYNKKLAKGNVIEIVCDVGKTIGIDVTNSKSYFGNCVSRKWLEKDYHKHLDEFWVVVFSNIFTEEDYKQWNNESPDNVKVFSIDDFLIELDYSIDEYTKNKIEKYKVCTFHTKDKLKGI